MNDVSQNVFDNLSKIVCGEYVAPVTDSRGISMIKHDPLFDTDAVCEHYSKRDGVPIKYVCTTELMSNKYFAGLYDIFYRDTPHPQFGNKYFALTHRDGNVYISNADSVEDYPFSMISDGSDYYYSRYRHDCVFTENDLFIDGGRSYARTNTETFQFIVSHGELVYEPQH